MKFSTQALLLVTSITMPMVEAGKIEDWSSFGTRRRQLLQSLAPSKETLDKCSQEYYTLYLGSVEQHLGMLAKPKEHQQDCPTLAFHAVRTEEDDLVKLAHEYADDEDLDKLEIGSFALDRIVQAHTVAPAGSFLDKYSFFHNNCGSFLINMGEELDINPNTPSIVGFVSNQLSKKTTLPEVMKSLYGEEDGVEFIENYHIQSAAGKPKPFYREVEGMEIGVETEEEKAIVGDFVATYIEEHHTSTTSIGEDMLLLGEESGAMAPAASVVAAALATAARALIMMV